VGNSGKQDIPGKDLDVFPNAKGVHVKRDYTWSMKLRA